MRIDPDVLVVDDDAAINRLIGAFLQNVGYSTRSAPDGVSALDQMDLQIPGLVLLDIMLPDLSGFDICRTIRSSSKAAHVPVILVSALVDRDSRLAGQECGATDYLGKPFNPDDLLMLVDRYMRPADMRVAV